MTTLQELIAQRDELDKKIEAAKAAQPNPAAMFVPRPARGEAYFLVNSNPFGKYLVGDYLTSSNNEVEPAFATREHAEAIAFVRSIEDKMRAQPGCVVAEDGVEQWFVLFASRSREPICGSYTALDAKLYRNQFGAFDTKENLEAAIQTVGAENLIRAAKAKVGIY